MLQGLARAYSTVFDPALFVLLCGLLLFGHEWRHGRGRSTRDLGVRLAVLSAGWLLGVAVYKGVPLLVGPVPKWIADTLGTMGLVVGFGLIGAVWHLRDWGGPMPAFVALLLAISVPHVLITPFWDISSHVLYTVVPAGALVGLDRRYLLLAIVPVGMVFARPLAGVHTWPQVVAGFALGVAALLVAARTGAVPTLERSAPRSGGAPERRATVETE